MTIIATIILTTTSTYAFSGTGTGVSGDPFLINNCSALQDISSNVTAVYQISNNIDCNGFSFTPIADFSGIIDGQYKIISDLTINTGVSGGLFASVITPAIVANISLENISITTSSSYNGGIIGLMSGGILINSYTTGTVTGGDYTGGVIGNMEGVDSPYVNNSYSKASVSGSSYTGGFVGAIQAGSISNSYSIGAVTASGTPYGFAGYSYAPVEYNCFWDNETSGLTSSTGAETAKSTAEMMAQTTFTNWDFTNTWTIEEGIDYPELQGNELIVNCTDNDDCSLCMKCSAGNCINQTSIEDLKDECTTSYTGCFNEYTIIGDSGNCDGSQACSVNNIQTNVTEGQVCISGTSTEPTIAVNCNEQYDCITGHGDATGYYTGYLGDGTSTCSDLNWVISGNEWNTTNSSYSINVTEHNTVCTEELIPCNPNWSCSNLETCNINNTETCLNVSDSNDCDIPFNGTITDYNEVCVYTIPSTFTYGQDDIGAVVFDAAGKTAHGIGSVAFILGIILAFGIAMVIIHYAKKK